MRTRLAILTAVLAIIVCGSSNAFPLTGGNGQVNATVLGTFYGMGDTPEHNPALVIDIVSSERLSEGAVVLVDSEDKFYKSDSYDGSRLGIEVGVNDDKAQNAGIPTQSRRLWTFSDLPSDVEIKRVRISPPIGDPFSIEWTGVPEAISQNMSLKFYGVKVDNTMGVYGIISNSDIKQLTADVKITNKGNRTKEIQGDHFEVVDQFGFHYPGYKRPNEPGEKLLPGESMRSEIYFTKVSQLSRPVYLIYIPANLSLDISAWT